MAMYAQMNYKDPFCFYGTVSENVNNLKAKIQQHAKNIITSLKELEIQNAAG
ncbi:hypothetical protein [Chryseobacterium soldanellicola]|uniref:hypothetical protein n=1 Tax=Chryseobacterium soldanellicola TaxID=311333 RepID=UPI00147C14B8|nr:hypothetical protein [Chryseobacterium soldanellicola]